MTENDLSELTDEELDRLLHLGRQAQRERDVRQWLGMFAEEPTRVDEARAGFAQHKANGLPDIAEYISRYAALARWDQGERPRARQP